MEARGRRRAAYGGGALATAVVIGAVATFSQGAGGEPPRTTTATVPSRPTPPERVQETHRQRENTVTAGRPRQERDDTEDLMHDTEAFRFGLFDIAAEHLDPEKQYLDYSTRSLQSSSDATGHRSLGIKLGWKVPGQPGEGMVQIQVSDMTGPDRPRCGEHLEMTCRTLVMPDGRSVEVGETGDGGYDVLHQRGDGTIVHVRVDPLFGNNSLVPVQEMRIDRREVYRLVRDERIELPELW